MFKGYSFELRGPAASRVFGSLRRRPDMVSLAYAAQDPTQRQWLVEAAAAIASAEHPEELEVNKYISFMADRWNFRKSKNGYQIILPNIPLCWETYWGPSSAPNRCPVCGWPRSEREPPPEIARNGSCLILSSMDQYLVVWHDIVDRLEREGIEGASFVPVADPDADKATVFVCSGSFEGNARRLRSEFPSWLSSSDHVKRVSDESRRVFTQQVEVALEEAHREKDLNLTGEPEPSALIRLPGELESDPILAAFKDYVAPMIDRDMIDVRVYPPPPAGRASKWYVVQPTGPSVKELDSTRHDAETACPECGLQPVMKGPLRLPKAEVEGRDLLEASGQWIVASDRVCRLLRKYAVFDMASVALV